MTIIQRLRNPPLGTETSERNLMAQAAAEIERLRQRRTEIDNEAYEYAEQIKRLRALLAEARDDIRCEVENRYPLESRHYPAEMRRYQSEMDLVHRIEAALATDPTA